MSSWVTLYCQACGESHEAKSTQRLWHSRCKARRQGATVPRYVPEADLPKGVTAQR